MKNSDFKKQLTQALHAAPPAGKGLEQTILLLNAQAVAKRRRDRIPFRRLLTKQVRYLGWPFWGVQAVLLLAFDRILTQLYGERFWDSPVSVARLLFIVSTLVSMMALPLLYRSRKYRMQEIESASYFSSPRLLAAKLAVIGLGDGLLLCGICLTTLVRTSMHSGSLTFYLLAPFLVITAAYLYMMGHCTGNGFFVGSLTLGCAMLLLAALLPGRWMPLFRQSMTLGWLAFCAALLLFCAGQLRYLLRRSPYAQLQLL